MDGLADRWREGLGRLRGLHVDDDTGGMLILQIGLIDGRPQLGPHVGVLDVADDADDGDVVLDVVPGAFGDCAAYRILG